MAKFGLPPSRNKVDFLAPHAEELYRVYILEMGTARSLRRLARYCEERGWTNNKGKTYTSSVVKAIWRWATRIENFEKAYAIYQEAMRNEGKFITKEEFKNGVLLEHVSVHQHQNQGKVDRFLRRNGYTLPSKNRA